MHHDAAPTVFARIALALALSALPLSGQAQGRFFGPNAVETGGNFALRSTAGTPYTAAGIFYGR